MDFGADAVEIVLADKQDRQLPELGPVEGFVEGALVDRPVPEETGGDAVFTPVARGKGQADRDGELSPDNGVAAHKVQAGVEQVHGTTLALADAGGFAEQFGHNPPGIGTAHDGLGVFAVGEEDVVILMKTSLHSNSHHLLTVVKVQESGNMPFGIL